MPNTYRSATIARLWAIIEADPDLASAITAVRRIKDDRLRPVKTQALRAPADKAHVEITLGPGFGGSLFRLSGGDDRPAQTFATERPGFDPDSGSWVERASADFTIRIVYRRDSAAEDRDTLEMRILEAIRAAGPGLAYEGSPLSGVVGIDPYRATTGEATLNAGQPNSEPVIATTITLTVRYEFEGADLIGGDS